MVYRVGRVVSHRSDAGRMLVEADVPRRFIAQVTAPLPEDARA
jgi:hypothetical protein